MTPNLKMKIHAQADVLYSFHKITMLCLLIRVLLIIHLNFHDKQYGNENSSMARSLDNLINILRLLCYITKTIMGDNFNMSVFLATASCFTHECIAGGAKLKIIKKLFKFN